MKFLLTYQQNPNLPPPTPEKMKAIGDFAMNQMKAGVLVMTGGLVRPTKGTRIQFDGSKITVTDGPYAETKELIDGFALVKVGSKEEAVRLASEFMRIAGEGDGEILQVFDQADNAPGPGR